MRFAIFGSGGLGAYYGIRLLQGGHEVAFIARGPHLDAIRKDGLRLSSPLGDAHLQGLTATADPAEVGEVDVVIVAVKTWQIPEVASAMAPMLGTDTIVLPFLNGVEAAPQLAETVGSHRVLGGLSKIFSLIEAPGLIKHFSQQAIVDFGEMNGTESERCEALRAAFAQARVEVNIAADIVSDLWRKLLMVSSWAGVGTLSHSSIGQLRDFGPTRELIDRSMSEGIAVARACGMRGDTEDVKNDLWGFYGSMPGSATLSMQRDIWDGKPSELEAWNGAIVRFGREHGIATPVHEFTYATLLPMERRARGEAE